MRKGKQQTVGHLLCLTVGVESTWQQGRSLRKRCFMFFLLWPEGGLPTNTKKTLGNCLAMQKCLVNPLNSIAKTQNFSQNGGPSQSVGTVCCSALIKKLIGSLNLENWISLNHKIKGYEHTLFSEPFEFTGHLISVWKAHTVGTNCQ